MELNNKTGPGHVAVEVWADLGCPWCYIGKHRLQRAIAARPDAGRFRMTIRSFELDPIASAEPESVEAAFIRKHGGDPSVVLQAEKRLQAIAHSEGLRFELNRLAASTFDLHRVMHFAQQSGKGVQFFSQVQDRFFSGEIYPYDHDVMVAVAVSLGLDDAGVREILAGNEFGDDVRRDVAEGAALGGRGVPFTVIGRRIAVSGAQSVTAYGRALDQALQVTGSEQVPV